jgi:hypothetical protein
MRKASSKRRSQSEHAPRARIPWAPLSLAFATGFSVAAGVLPPAPAVHDAAPGGAALSATDAALDDRASPSLLDVSQSSEAPLPFNETRDALRALRRALQDVDDTARCGTPAVG